MGQKIGKIHPTLFRSNLTTRERTVSGGSFTNEIMVETPCQKQKSSNLSKIEEDLDRLNIEGNMESDRPDEFIWYFCDNVIKGYRDPQVGLEENSVQ